MALIFWANALTAILCTSGGIRELHITIIFVCEQEVPCVAFSSFINFPLTELLKWGVLLVATSYRKAYLRPILAVILIDLLSFLFLASFKLFNFFLMIRRLPKENYSRNTHCAQESKITIYKM